MLVHECITYSLFQPQEDVNEDASSNFGRTVLFGEVEDQGLYYEKIGVFIEALQSLTEFQTIGSEEMVVTFPEIGISISAVSLDLIR